MSSAELHGALCGWLAGGGGMTPDWLANVMADPALPAVAAGGALDRLRAVSASQFDDRSFAFELLLPDDTASIGERSGALFDWCRGFLGGFGLAAGENPPLGEDSADALRDLARMAASELSYEDPENDEESLSEITEFVRVAALLLHGDCVLGPRHRKSLN